MERLHDPVWTPDSGAACGPDRAARVQGRFRDERLRLLRCHVSEPAAAILAARNAGTLATTAAAGLPLDAMLPQSLWPFEALSGDLPAPELLDRCALALCGSPLDTAAGTAVARGWELARAAESLLVQGGDERLFLDQATGLNRYGCAPHPRPGVAAFASCTSSSVSAAGLATAETARRGLLAGALRAGHRATVDAGCAEAASRILDHYGVRDLAVAFLVPSGTDAALLATAMVVARLRDHPTCGEAGRMRPGKITSFLVDAAETGSGVPAAARCRHFAHVAATGEAVARGEALAGCPASIGLETVALREAWGDVRPLGDIHDAFEQALERCCAEGHAILHRVDCSKTGLGVPGAEVCRRWSARFGDRLTIIVDASQARLDAAEVQRSLKAGWPVILTGSKFFGGPGFCGVLLLPAAQADAITAKAPLMAGLGTYAAGLAADPARAEWHAGLLLRWVVSLREMDAFRGRDAGKVEARLREHGRRIVAHVRADPRLTLVAAGGSAPDDLAARSIFPFTVRAPHADRLMRPDELALVHAWMGRDLGEAVGAARRLAVGAGRWRQIAASRCQIGQPVRLGQGPSGPLGGLRLALGAAQLMDDDDEGAALSLVFAKLGLVLDHFADLPGANQLAVA